MARLSDSGIGRDQVPSPVSEPPPPLRIRNLHFRDAAPGWVSSHHSHRTPQWYWCSYGSVTVSIDGTVHTLRSEEGIIVAPDAIREIRVVDRAAGYLVTIFEADPSLGFHAAFNRILALPGEARDDAHALVAEVCRPGGADARLLTTVLATRVLIALLRLARSGASGPGLSALNAEGHAEVVAQAETFMLRNLNRQLKRADIAAAVNLSEPHLARLFKAVTGHSLIDRLVDLRMEQARVLLLESTMSVTQIAITVGITSFSYFSKAFRAATGMSPSDFRKSGGRVAK